LRSTISAGVTSRSEASLVVGVRIGSGSRWFLLRPSGTATPEKVRLPFS
jgi:hypothetical protein